MAISDQQVRAIIDWLAGELKEGSVEDLAARRALAEVLRHEKLDMGIRLLLANLIDPDSRDDIGLWLVFKRPQGRTKTIDRRKVAAIIWKQVKAGIKKEAAVADAMKKCGVKSRDKALAAYKEWKPHFEKWAPKLKDLTKTD
jgi:hypothetical protein